MAYSASDEVFRFIKTYLKSHQQLSPSLREIAEGCHMHTSTAARYVELLAAEGRIERQPGRARTIRLTKKPRPTSVSKPRQIS